MTNNLTDFPGNISEKFPLPVDTCGRKIDLVFEANTANWQWITRISFPVLLILGTLGNVYGIIAGWMKYRYSQRIFLIGMCAVSLLYLWNELILLVGQKAWDLSINVESNFTELYRPFYLYIGGILLYFDQLLYLASQWILLMFCLERCVAITFPIFHYTRKSRLFGGLTVTIIFCLSAVIGILVPVIWYYNVDLTGTLENKQPVRTLPYSIHLWRDIDTWWELLFTVVVYFAVLGCNLLLVRSLQRNRRRLTVDSTSGLHLNTGKDSSSCSEASNTSTISEIKIFVHARCVPTATRTQILVASSVFFLLTHLLKVAMVVLVIMSRAPVCAFQISMAFLDIYDPFTSMLQNTYYAFGFVFLVWLSTADRKKLGSLCCNRK